MLLSQLKIFQFGGLVQKYFVENKRYDTAVAGREQSGTYVRNECLKT